MNFAIKNLKSPLISDFTALITMVSQLVHEASGIQLGEKQEAMIKSRLMRRILDLKLDGPEAYIEYIKQNSATENHVLVSLLTTHHTFFFREFEQFDYLLRVGLPQIINTLKQGNRRKIRIWSMACSRGQEVYSLSMFLDYHLKKLDPSFSFEILGTDIDRDSVATAKNGVYRWDEIKEIPAIYLGRHWARGSGQISEYVKAKPTLKANCRFDVGNLLDLSPFAKEEAFDFIFCRNVFIYFTPAQIEAISKKILKKLAPHGMLFLGVSESLNGLNLDTKYHGQSVYTHKSAPGLKVVKEVKIDAKTDLKPATVAADKPIRVICVDDSPTVLKLLKTLLTREKGFEIAATAVNGIDAAAQMKSGQFDVMTLDIHMPELNGVDYLSKYFNGNHPPVVMVSSVSREEASLGLKALELGASDYVEKPSMTNLTERGDELRTKLRCAVLAAKGNAVSDSRGAVELAKSFERVSKVTNPQNKIRVIIAGAADKNKVTAMLRQMVAPQPPTIILLDVQANLVPALMAQMSTETKAAMEAWSGSIVTENKIYVGCLKDSVELLKPQALKAQTSILAFGSVSPLFLKPVFEWKGDLQLVVEDLGSVPSDGSRDFMSRAEKCVPYTSFLFDSDYFFNRR